MLNFVPSEFIIPEKMETEEYRLRMLSIDDVEKDFEAVISSAEHVSTGLARQWLAGWAYAKAKLN